MSLSQYQTSYQISPIILVGGIAIAGPLPIVNILNSQNYDLGILSPSSQPYLEGYFGQFKPLSGHTLMDNEVATYPAANQAVAANAIITNPLRISFEMIAPANSLLTVANKLSIMTALKSNLDQHTAQGGWYNLATPSFIYQGGLLTLLKDVTDELDGGQVQVCWQWDFLVPLLTVEQAQAAQNQSMATLSSQTAQSQAVANGQPITTGVGQPSSNIVQNLVPAASSPVGSNVAPGGLPVGTVNLSSVSPISPEN